MARGRRRNRRGMITVVILLVATALFSGRLFQIQVVDASEYNEISAGKRAVPFVIPSVRGDIVDRNGTVLATTDERYDVQLSPKNTQAPQGIFYRKESPDSINTVPVSAEQAFAEIGAITGQTAEEIKTIVDDALAIDPKSDFAYVKRGINLEQLDQLKALGIPWLTFDYNYQRLYPNGAVGGNLVGFAGQDAIAQAGVELSMDECLTGTDGFETYERGADGVRLPGSHIVREHAEPGGTVDLTIDVDLQWQAQQLVNDYMSRLGTEWVLGVVMDAKTGELLAVAEDGSVDPGDVEGSTKREARSFVAPYEPGSTHKTVTIASLLEEGIVTPTTEYLTPWLYSPEPGVQFSDVFQHEEMPWTTTGVYVYSSNVGTAMLGTRLPAEKRYEYMLKFGLGQSTNAGLPLEDSGLLYPPENWDRQTYYNVTFGQGFSSTIIQTAGVYQTIANGGVRIPPKLVRGCTDHDGTYHEYDHGEPVRVVSANTADQITRMMETLVETTFTDLIAIPGYQLVGKTGTSEQSDGQGSYRNDFVHSFAGFFPASDPKYVVVASVGFPAVYEWGSPGAMTLMRELAEATIRTMKVEPVTGAPRVYPIEYE